MGTKTLVEPLRFHNEVIVVKKESPNMGTKTSKNRLLREPARPCEKRIPKHGDEG